MNKLLSLFTAITILSASTQALAGGIVPQGMGMYKDGRTIDLIPASSSLVRWQAYGSVLTPGDRDMISYAVSTVDVETQEFTFKWLDGNEVDEGQIEVNISGKSDPLWPECADATAGGCTYAVTTCLAKVRQGSYDLCTSYRVNLYMKNIEFGANKKLVPQPIFLKGIVRHELGHVLGLSHFDPGPMTTNLDNQPFSQCQHDLWKMFIIDPAIPTWTYPAEPVSCQ